MPNGTGLVICALCVWRVTHLLHAEAGPFDLAAKLRARAGAGFWGQALACFYCCSLWVAIPVTLILSGLHLFLLIWPALSGAACLLEQATTRENFPGYIHEDKE